MLIRLSTGAADGISPTDLMLDGVTLIDVTTGLPYTLNPASAPAPISGQIKITTAGTAVQFPSAALRNGAVIKAATQNNAAGAFIGPSGVNDIDDATGGTTGNGYRLLPGEPISFSGANLNQLFVNSANAGDVFYYFGN